jgi:tripartite-type tricarboxylate transporter receptor subunit TctC
MKLPRRQFLHLEAGAAALPAFSRIARAQSYPARPVRLIVTAAPGGAMDITARLIGQWLSERLDQQFIIENRPGAGFNIGTEAVVRAPPDGYTLLVVSVANTVNATLHDRLNFNFIRDIAPVAGIIRVPLVMEVNPSVPAKTVPEFITYAKANPGKLNFGYGLGTLPQILGEAFKTATGTEIASIPYRGGAQAITDMLGGRIQMNFGTQATLLPLIREGKIRALAVTTDQRAESVPDVPTMAEAGLPVFEASLWFAVVAPAAMPPAIVARLNREINAILDESDVKKALAGQAIETELSTPEKLRERIGADIEKWRAIAAKAGIRAE